MSIRIAHLGDLHFGYSHLGMRRANGQNVREHDFERSAMLVADYLLQNQPDIVLIAGDLLQATRVSSTGLNGAIEFCRTLTDAGMTVVVIPGNHDESEAPGRFSDLQTCANHGGIVLLDKQEHYDYNGLRIHAVPFRALSRARRGSQELLPFDFSPDHTNILLAHAYAAGANIPKIPEGEEIEIPPAWLTEPRFALVCLGHVHRHTQVYERAFYSGSTERRNFGERNETPGFWMHTLEEGSLVDSESILISQLSSTLPRPMLQLEVNAADLSAPQLTQKVLEALEEYDLTGAMVKVVIEDVSSTIDRSLARQTWKRYFFDEAGGFSWEDVLQTRQIAELFNVEFESLPVDISAAFQTFLDAQTFEGDNEKKALLDLAAEIMTSAHERLIAEDL